MKNIMVVINPKSGNESGPGMSEVISQYLSDYFDQIDLRITDSPDDPARYGKEAAEKHYDSIMIVGGDGTINACMAGFAKSDHRPKIALIPAGTGNLLATVLGVSLIKRVALRSYKFTKTQKLSMGFCNDQVFSMFASLGAIPEAIHDVSSDKKTALGFLAYVFSSIEKLATSTPYQIKLTSEQDSYSGSVDHLLVSLTDRLGILRFTELSDTVKEGKANIFIQSEHGFLNRFETVSNALVGKVENSNEIQSLVGSEIVISGPDQETIHIDLDGEKGPALPVSIKVIPDYNEFYLPEAGLLQLG